MRSTVLWEIKTKTTIKFDKFEVLQFRKKKIQIFLKEQKNLGFTVSVPIILLLFRVCFFSSTQLFVKA